MVEGFSSRYDADRLVPCELFADAESANTREKQVKKLGRAWKIRLIADTNPEWKDLYDGMNA